jgi:hypothetical protein
VAKVAFGLKNSAACDYGQMSFEDWQAANPAGFKPWWQAVAAASEAWDLASFKVNIAETQVAAAVQAVVLLIQEAAKAQDVAASSQETVLKDQCDVADLKNQWDMLKKQCEQAKDEALQDEQKAMEIGFRRWMKSRSSAISLSLKNLLEVGGNPIEACENVGTSGEAGLSES